MNFGMSGQSDVLWAAFSYLCQADCSFVTFKYFETNNISPFRKSLLRRVRQGLSYQSSATIPIDSTASTGHVSCLHECLRTVRHVGFQYVDLGL